MHECWGMLLLLSPVGVVCVANHSDLLNMYTLRQHAKFLLWFYINLINVG